MKCKLPEINHSLRIEEMNEKYNNFYQVYSARCKLLYDNAEESEIFNLDFVFRKNNDAVVIIPYQIINGEPYIYLVSCFRPHRDITNYKGFKESNAGNTWELPAGLVEDEEAEEQMEGYKKAASRELLEETGLNVSHENMRLLGKRTFTGAQSERLFFFATEIKEEKFEEIKGDGHPLEKHGQVCKISLKEAFSYVQNGDLTDIKTEIGIYRLHNFLI